MYNTLISETQLFENLENPDWIVIDCRYDLANVTAGHHSYLESHIPGSIYADLHKHLAGETTSDSGRHPLPDEARLIEVFSSFGIDADKQVVAYDGASRAFAARLWWLLRYMGHTRVAVLDGGWQAWLAQNRPSQAGDTETSPAKFSGRARSDRVIMLDQVAQSELLVDSREAARYRGEVEPVDPVAGHIPGARNYCFQNNLTADSRFLTAHELKKQFKQLFSGTEPEKVVFYCGSGVTACHNLLAMAHAGLPEAILYAGSWSEWCRSGERPVATGPD
ncbi:MAG: sulfurtransferase [Gammaproteobacteria bacterium]|nr:sulfurtransferase [Gammaproteobacteria bacterium]